MILALLFSLSARADEWTLTGTGLNASVAFGSAGFVDVATLLSHKHLYKVQCGTINQVKTCRFVDQSATDNRGTYTTTAIVVKKKSFTITTKVSDGFVEDRTFDDE